MSAIQIDIPENTLNLPESIKIKIKKFTLNHCESVQEARVHQCISKYLDLELSIKDIYEVCQCIERCYAEHGYFLARAYPPPQSIKGGCLTLEILEGRLGSVEIVDNRYYSNCFIRGYFSNLEGRPLHYCQFLRALLLLNENIDLTASAIFKKGQEVGTADVVLRLTL